MRAEVVLQTRDELEPWIRAGAELVPGVGAHEPVRHVPAQHLVVDRHRRVVEVVLVQQDLVVEEPRRERVRLPVPRSEERVRKIGLARHHQQAPVEADRVAREPVPAVLDHQAAAPVLPDHRQPAVLVVERARRRGVEVGKPGSCADLVEEHAVDRHLRLPPAMNCWIRRRTYGAYGDTITPVWSPYAIDSGFPCASSAATFFTLTPAGRLRIVGELGPTS